MVEILNFCFRRNVGRAVAIYGSCSRLPSSVSIAILLLIFSTLVREFMAFLERRNPTRSVVALTEFLVTEQVRRKFSYSDSFAISSSCIIRCSCRHITSILNFEVWVASLSFLESFSTERVLKVLIKEGH